MMALSSSCGDGDLFSVPPSASKCPRKIFTKIQQNGGKKTNSIFIFLIFNLQFSHISTEQKTHTQIHCYLLL